MAVFSGRRICNTIVTRSSLTTLSVLLRIESICQRFCSSNRGGYMRLTTFGISLLGALLFSLSAPGQESLSTLRGTATDSSGAVIPGVAVTVREVSTNIVARKILTDEQGNYEIPGLKQGTYRLTAQSTGFKSFAANEIILGSNQVRRIDIRLEVGATESEVTVTASAAVIETEQGKIAAEFRGERYKDIPIPGNSYGATTTVLAVLPTVQTAAGGQSVS